MSFSFRFHDTHLPKFTNNRGRFLFWGVILTLLGLAAISAATFTTLISVVVLGFVVFCSGVIMAADTFTFWWGKWGGFFLHLLIAILYLYVGIALIGQPAESAAAITLILGVFYLLVGAFRIGTASALQMPNWGWYLVSGIIAFILGILIITNWQAASFFIIGLFVGIDLLFVGINYLMAASAGKKLSL